MILFLICKLNKFYRNVSFDTTEDDLQEYFEKYGELEYAKIVYNRETEHSKGKTINFVCSCIILYCLFDYFHYG